MSTTIETSRYIRSHLKAPKGRGYWLFENRAGEIVFSHNGTYTEACRAAKAAKVAALLFVCP